MTHKIDVSKGECISTVSAQWSSRPDDQKFTSLSDLRQQVAQWADESSTVLVRPADIVCAYDEAHPDVLTLAVAGAEFNATHYAFDAVARAAGAPANYLRSLPAPLAAVNLNYGLQTSEQDEVSAYIRQNGSKILRGITSPRYGRIYDREVVDAVMKVAGNGTGDTRWKVPGCIDWRSEFGVAYNPNVNITKQNTTLYASDRDVFLFLVDDRNPIEVGKLDDGSPDLMFRGFYVWNSEVGSKTFGFASMYLRGVCQNRNLWGVEGFQQLTFRHTSGAPERFLEEGAPALLQFAESSTTALVAGVAAAKAAIVAKDDEEGVEFLAGFGFSERAAKRIISTAMAEEGHPPVSVWDFAQGVTATAREEEFQESRIALERVAGRMLDKVAA